MRLFNQSPAPGNPHGCTLCTLPKLSQSFATWSLLSLPTRLVLRGQELYARLVVAGSASIRYYDCIWVTAGRIEIECMFAPKRQTTTVNDSLVPQHSPDKCHHELAKEKNSPWARPTRLLPPLRQGIPRSDTRTRAYPHVRRDSCLTVPMRGNDTNPSEST